MDMESGDDRGGGGGGGVGGKAGKQVGPLIPRKANVRANVGEESGALPVINSLGSFPNDVSMRLGVERTITLHYSRDLLQCGTTVRENNACGGGSGINEDKVQGPELGGVGTGFPDAHGANDGAPFPEIVQYRRTSTVVPVDKGAISVTNIRFRKTEDKLIGLMTAVSG